MSDIPITAKNFKELANAVAMPSSKMDQHQFLSTCVDFREYITRALDYYEWAQDAR